MLSRSTALIAAACVVCGATASARAQERTLDAELEALRLAAETEASQETASTADASETTFRSGGLGLQALNP